ncbi:MAG: isoleucine--tRNA ligase [Chloroflexi bacterium]|nr:isoleucine--tRNA ligase [Chloroflexota bacterium]MCY3582837.1 isoleucine--tRNA ligase [Chloroflexota bacterium]MCY3715511.1 isoleucine--tRNA ligase [Chloroflexota bacterium]MDE2651242.1 isoleucine--tRNA ligase [Chloroflexota bacterium]MXX49659.1 isoleucine--tRNA ligase [Chloroflexota bacterium]
MFSAVDTRVNSESINRLEQQQLDFWRFKRIFERTTEGREDSPRYVFYEGPPTANGKPGSHHVLARAFKDMFPRYKVMQGYYCLRRGGWDTHGLPVEIEVEKELGFDRKAQIEDYGVAEFNARCRDNVFRHINEWEKLTERTGFWVNLDDAYITFSNDYIESVWWILKRFWDKGLLYRGYKVVPYSPSSGTPLSSHEVAQGYKTITDPSVFVRFPLRDKPGVYMLAWTTTPWTLPANAALAVGADVSYVLVEGPAPDSEDSEQLIIAEALMEQVLHDASAYRIVDRMTGKDLLGWRYQPLYTFLPVEQDYAYVVAADYVSTSDGTGIVHTAPAYGVDDLATGRKYDLPVLITVDESGCFVDAVSNFRGMWFKDADRHIIADLSERGLMYRRESTEHSYPHNWRDGSPLMYFARETWFIDTVKYKQTMIDLNQTIKWVPGHVRDGRFGNWLEDLKEWSLGRERYWGTPLPVWRDESNGEMICVGSVDELSELAGADLSELDLHRPYVDEITFDNPTGEGGTMRRVPEVIDVWFDSGAMQLAQWAFPQQNRDILEEQHPADYICEAVDQTRGWFYSLHAIAAMLFETVAFKNVICLGHILDENGQKMSKSKGNIVDPWEVLEQAGADAFRWYLYTSGPPGEPRRFSINLVNEVIKKFWSTLWNTYGFFVTYANIDGWTPAQPAPEPAQRDPLDQWLLAELHNLIQVVTDAFEDYDATNATRPIEDFVERLSNWYVRLSRDRFWKSDVDDSKLSAYATLYEALCTVAQLLAPTMPFLSEAMYRNLAAEQFSSLPESVHLSQWPIAKASLLNDALRDEMALVQRLVSLGLAARNAAQLGVRQPLASAQFALRDLAEAQALEGHAALIKSELNLKALHIMGADETAEMSATTRYRLNPLPRFLGRKFGRDFKAIQTALRDGEQDFVRPYALQLLDGQDITLELDGAQFEILNQECEVKVSVEIPPGAVEDGGYMVILDTQLTPDLVAEGLARELVRRIQNLRKRADFAIDDRINIVYCDASDSLDDALQRYHGYISAYTLADTLHAGAPTNAYVSETIDVKGQRVTIGLRRAR